MDPETKQACDSLAFALQEEERGQEPAGEEEVEEEVEEEEEMLEMETSVESDAGHSALASEIIDPVVAREEGVTRVVAEETVAGKSREKSGWIPRTKKEWILNRERNGSDFVNSDD